ncbi:MAG: spore germination protein GerW family protein [Candidatus Marinimicrobia bacterium]|nr:spore germination protein GerW family protein [Candidatus Neomarinimicrobiota bacterium]
MKFNETLATLLDKFKILAKTETVVGDPIVVQDTTLIPISKISIGFAIGGGEHGTDDKKSAGDGTGGGISVTPIAVVIVKEGKDSKLLWLEKGDGPVNKLLDLVPEILDRIAPENK